MPVDDTQINLSWQAPDDDGGTPITGYEISFSTSGGGSFRTDGNTFTYQHTGLEAGDTYHYQIAAINSVGRGAYSSTVSATVQGTGGTDGTDPGDDGGGNTGAPSVPLSLTATPASDTQIDLAWQAPTNTGGTAITAYQIQISIDGGNSFIDLHRTADGNTLSYQQRGLSAGTTYHYRVAAINKAGRGEYS